MSVSCLPPMRRVCAFSQPKGNVPPLRAWVWNVVSLTLMVAEDLVFIIFTHFETPPHYMRKLLCFSLLLSLICFELQAQSDNSTAHQSLLNSGDWFKIKVDTSGVFKLTFDELQKIGVDSPEDVRIYSYGGKNLSLYNDDFSFDDVNEIPIAVENGNDGVFNQGDYVYFFAEGPITLNYDSTNNTFVHSQNSYSNFTYLLLTSSLGKGKRIEIAEKTTQETDYTTDSYDHYLFFEEDKCNLVSSGRRWYGNKMLPGNSTNYTFHFNNLQNSTKIRGFVGVAGRKEYGVGSTFFALTTNGNEIANINVPNSYTTYRYATYYCNTFSFSSQQNAIVINCKFSSQNNTSEGYIDAIGLTAREKLVFSKKRQMFIQDAQSANYKCTEMRISNASNIRIWNVSNVTNPKEIELTSSNEECRFKFESNGTIQCFVAFSTDKLLTPIISGADVGQINNQNIHGISADMIIVAPTIFIEQANRLAELHKNRDKLNVAVVSIDEVYNEFSGGTPDVAAIRNFARQQHQHNNNFKYLLLFGDGTYDNRNILKSNHNILPTYQSIESESEAESYTSDDFFGMLENGEGELTGTMDISVGRLPASTIDEAETMVNKIETYLSEKSMGSWRNTIAFIADDEEDGVFVRTGETLSTTISQQAPECNIAKIYIDAYKQESNSSGQSYPTANETIKKQIASGCSIIGYIGHGNPRKIAHETILSTAEVQELKNGEKYPILITASCEVGRFDDHAYTSLCECFILNAEGGGIAALTAARVAYNSGNTELANNFFKNAFNNNLRLGDIVRIAKNNTGGLSEANKRCFILLGDPALKINIPQNKVYVSQINRHPITESCDTLHALDTITISGYIIDKNGDLLSKNGTLQATVFDKPIQLSTLGNDEDSPIINFETQNSIIYKGKASVEDGFFSLSFIAPKDINYSYGYGKISLYATLDSVDANGYSSNIIIGGTNNNLTITDFDGPEIQLFINDTTFTNGGYTNSNPLLLARIFDHSGINTTGNGIGHNITATIDNNASNSIILNEYYEGMTNQSNCGELQYRLNNLSEGQHTLKLKVWDIYNNPSEAEISFVVKSQKTVAIGNISCYPNPMNKHTTFTINHNQTATGTIVSIDIFDCSGRKVATVNGASNDTKTQIDWNTNSSSSELQNGIYIYRVKVSNHNDEAYKSAKLVISHNK